MTVASYTVCGHSVRFSYDGKSTLSLFIYGRTRRFGFTTKLINKGYAPRIVRYSRHPTMISFYPLGGRIEYAGFLVDDFLYLTNKEFRNGCQ